MIRNRISVFAAALAVLLLASSAFAEDLASSKYNVLVLTPGHSQTIYFELDTIASHGDFHTCYVLALGGGTLSVRIGPASSVGEFAGIVYATTGIIGLQPVIEYAYNAESISTSAEIPDIGIAVLFTGVITGIGSPDFPLVMSMVVSHQE